MPTEGQIAVSPDGSQTAVFTGGQWVVRSPSAAPAQGGVFTLPANPMDQARIGISQAQLGLSQQTAASSAQDRAADNARADALLPYQQRKAAADAVVAERQANQAARPGANLTPVARSEAIQAYNDANALDRAADEIEKLYNTGPGSTSGIYGLADYLPTDSNQVFDDAGQRARGYVKRALGFTGGEGNTVAESSALYDPFLPRAGDRDARIVQKIEALRQLANDARGKSAITLGGRPDAQGNVVPLEQRDDDPMAASAMDVNRIAGGGGGMAAGFGATTGGGPLPPEMQAEHSAWLQQNLNSFDPNAYADFRTTLDQKYGFPADRQMHLDWATATKARLDQGGATIGEAIPSPERALTETEQLRNNLVSNPLGAAAVGAADMGSFGAVSGLAPQAMAALSESDQALPLMAGQIGGSIFGAGALGRASAALAGRVAPNLLGGGARAAAARGIGTDAAYSGIYGANSGGDPVSSAALGGAGSIIGRGVGRGIGATIGGGRLSAAAQALQDRGVPLTVGRRLGEAASRVEDKLASVPIVGDMVRRRQAEAFEGFNRAAFEEAGRPIGAQINDIGEAGVNGLRQAVGDAYTSATAGVDVPLDQQFVADMGSAIARGGRLPPDLQTGLRNVLEARVAPAVDTGNITGIDYQQAMRGLRETRRNPPQRFQGFEQDYRDAVSQAMDALTGQVQRGGGQGVVDGLGAANAANRNMKILENASLDRARIGTRTGEVGVFAPSQLVDAARAAERKYPGANPLKELGEQGQRVLPSTVPNSGTADRLMQAGLGAGLLGGSAGLDATAGTGVTPYTAALLALMTAGGTRVGQNMAGAIINSRPAAARAIGERVSRRRGLFGSGATGLALGLGG